jgi:hypothetical protein
MKTIARILAACVLALSAQSAWATPSTLFWTPATTYIQPYLIPHITYDTYFNDKANYPMDLGLTMGILPFEKIQAEVGLDFFFPYWGPQNALFLSPAGALQLNAKVGLTEGAFGDWFPGIAGGIYGVGVNQATQFDVLYGLVGKTFFFTSRRPSTSARRPSRRLRRPSLPNRSARGARGRSRGSGGGSGRRRSCPTIMATPWISTRFHPGSPSQAYTRSHLGRRNPWGRLTGESPRGPGGRARQ